MITFLKAFILSIVEGITEFLPVSSTGHMILVDSFLSLSANEKFSNAFMIIIQLGAILSVVVYFWKKIWILNDEKRIDKEKIELWKRVIAGVMPAVILGLLFDDFIDAHLFNATVVASMLIFYGIVLIIIEQKNAKKKTFAITEPKAIPYKIALIIGLFQCLAMVPGTSRSAATVIGGMLMGLSRAAAAEFSFFLAIPTMAGATMLKVIKEGLSFSVFEWSVILFGFVCSFAIALAVIKWFMAFIQKHDFKIFGWYRIVLGIVVLALMVFSPMNQDSSTEDHKSSASGSSDSQTLSTDVNETPSE